MTTTISLNDILLREMTSDDLSYVLQIEQTAHISPWARLSFEECLTKNDICRVMLLGQNIVGYHIISTVLDELHIMNIVCATQVQGKGFGHRLMDDIIELAKELKSAKLFLEVRASNITAQGLYAKWGFEQIALRKNYYRACSPNGEKEDALIFVRLM